MIPALRKAFNESFTEEKYQALLHELSNVHPGQLDFRIAETPIFIDQAFKKKLLDSCEKIVDFIVDPRFKEYTKNAVPGGLNVPNENSHCHFLSFDFGICVNHEGRYEPQLIEMQGFPTIFAYQVLYPDISRKHFPIPEYFDCYLHGYTRESYIQLLNEIIIKDCNPENVILLEVLPLQQKTRIDFFATEDYLGIKIVN